VKYYAWEEPFFNNADKFREAELGGLNSIAKSRATLINLLQSAITVATGVTIVRILNNPPAGY
jgi:hypothetical protein